VSVERPLPGAGLSRAEVIDYYVDTLSRVLGRYLKLAILCIPVITTVWAIGHVLVVGIVDKIIKGWFANNYWLTVETVKRRHRCASTMHRGKIAIVSNVTLMKSRQ
jgi:hypothetical protein